MFKKKKKPLPGSVKLELAKRSSFLSALKTQDRSIGATGGPGSSGGSQSGRMNLSCREKQR